LPGIVEMMEWYLESIRPSLLGGRAEIPDLFIGEGGKPISDEVVYQAFTRVIKAAGLSKYGFCPHELRHTNTTMSCAIIGTKATQGQLGHAFESTTEGYNHVPAREKGRQVQNAVNRMFNMSKKTEDK
jgi:site-specific recombinase XerD